MTKREVVWLIIRLAGLYFLWNAVTSAATLVAGLQAFLQAFDAYALAQRGSGVVLAQMLFMTVLYSALGLYCVNNGRVFFHVLNRESDG